MANALESVVGLTLITDAAAARQGPIERTIFEVADLAIQGGATAVQYRAKNTSTKERIRTGSELKEAIRGRVPLVVNDDPFAAVELSADGIHVGQTDMPPAEVRKIVGEDMILGLTVSSPGEAEAALASGARIDYFGTGPFRRSRTKPDSPVLLYSVISEINQVAPEIPIVAVGVDLHNASRIIAAGANGLAVAGIGREVDIENTAGQLRQIVSSRRVGITAVLR